MTDVTSASARLLRPLGLPEPPQQPPRRSESLSLQRSPIADLPASRCCSHGAASAAVHALHCSTIAAAPEAIAPISLELEAWPLEPSTPSTTSTADSDDCSECDSTSPTTIPSLRRRFSLGRVRGHARANSVDSTTTDSSVSSSLSTSSTRSRWSIFAPILDELTASNHRSDYVSEKRSRQARAVWREYW